MKKILLLRENLIEVGHEFEVLRFLRKYLTASAQIVEKTLLDIEMEIAQNKVEIWVDGHDLKEFDLVWIRKTGSKYYRFGVALAHGLEFLKVKYFDTIFGKTLGGDKLICLVRLAAAGLPIPKTYICWQSKLQDKKEILLKKFSFPLVGKLLSGHWGSQVFMLQNSQDLQNFIAKAPPLKLVMFQEYIPHGKGDFRILVLDYQVGSWEKMFRGGFQYPQPVGELQGKEFYPVARIPPQMADLAIKAAHLMSMEVAGVDIIEDERTGKYYFTEVNRTPGFAIDYPGDPELLAVAKFLEKNLDEKK